MACNGCSGETLSAPAVQPPAAALVATIPDSVPLPVTACKCGRIPWLWLVAALLVGVAIGRRRRQK